MSEALRASDASAGHNIVGPDYFSFYVCEIAELLSQDEEFLPFSSQTSDLADGTRAVIRDEYAPKHNYSGKEAYSLSGSSSISSSLFFNTLGAKLSDIRQERLRTLLHQSVAALSEEVDEMLDPVLRMCRIQTLLRNKKSLSSKSSVPSDVDAERHPHKKLKLSSSSSSIGIPMHASPVNCRVNGEDSGCEGIALPEKVHNDFNKHCTQCQTTQTSNSGPGPAGPKSLCDGCGSKLEKEKNSLSIMDPKKESCLDSTLGSEKVGEVDDDLLFLLENDCSEVEEVMKRHSDELSATLGHMEQRLEELIDTVVCNCRLMNHNEKRQLWKLIKKLPPRNLDRVVEIVSRSKPSGRYTHDEIHVDLEAEDNVTLWRLYYYVTAVDSARKLPV